MNTGPTDKPTLKTPTDPEPVSLKPPVGVSPSQNLPSNNLDKNPWDTGIGITPDASKTPDIKPLEPKTLETPKPQVPESKLSKPVEPQVEKVKPGVEKEIDNSAKPPSKSSKTLFILVPIFLLIAIGGSLLVFKQPNLQLFQSYFKAPKESEPGEIKETLNMSSYAPENPALGSGDYAGPYLVLDTSDSAWQLYKPKNIEITPNSQFQEAIVSWDSPSAEVKPYAWLIGYWHQSFDPTERFHVDNEQIKWGEISKSSIAYDNKRHRLILDLSEFPTKKTYFYFFVRVETQPDKYTDFVYGSDEQNQTPFMVEIE